MIYGQLFISLKTVEGFKKMKEEEKQRKFHEALLKMLYLPPSDFDKVFPQSSANYYSNNTFFQSSTDRSSKQEDEEKEDDQAETNLIKLLNDPPGVY